MKKFITTSLIATTIALAPVSALAQGNQYKNNPAPQGSGNTVCVNNGVRKYDGSGNQNKESQNKNKKVNQGSQNNKSYQNNKENCPNDGIKPLDGTGLKSKNQNK